MSHGQLIQILPLSPEASAHPAASVAVFAPAPVASADCAAPNVFKAAVEGMDCPGCAADLERMLRSVPGVASAEVAFLVAQARVTYDAVRTSEAVLLRTIQSAGYKALSVNEGNSRQDDSQQQLQEAKGKGGGMERLVGPLAAAVPLLTMGILAAEQWGPAHQWMEHSPLWLRAGLLLAAGGGALLKSIRGLLQRRITSHTLLCLGALASAVAGEWSSALMIALFMRFAEWLERYTGTRTRSALLRLTQSEKGTARVLREGHVQEVDAAELRQGDVLEVRQGELLHGDGRVLEGSAALDEARITGDSFPAERGPGDQVFAGTRVVRGSMRISVTRVGAETTLGQIGRMVQEVDARRTPMQRLADRFAQWYLPVVLGVAVLSYVFTGRVENSVSVLVVACACAIALATPLVVLAGVASGLKEGLLVRGGAALELLSGVDTVLLDKTGTLTQGRPEVSEVVCFDGATEAELLRAAGSLEAWSGHPIARAVLQRAERLGVKLAEAAVEAKTGRGLVGRINAEAWMLGNRRLLGEQGCSLSPEAEACAQLREDRGQTVFFVAREGVVRGLISMRDPVRPEAAEALEALRALGVREFCILTGDTESSALPLARELGLQCRAGLLPEEKLAAIREFQAQGRKVLMVGDGVNDGPALAAADVGVAMGGAGSELVLETADIVLLRDDLRLTTTAMCLGRRASQILRQNLTFSAGYNLLGLTAAALGWLPPVWAAAVHNLPDVVVLGNSARLSIGSARKPIRKRQDRTAPVLHVHSHAAPRLAHAHGGDCCECHAHA